MNISEQITGFNEYWQKMNKELAKAFAGTGFKATIEFNKHTGAMHLDVSDECGYIGALFYLEDRILIKKTASDNPRREFELNNTVKRIFAGKVNKSNLIKKWESEHINITKEKL